MLIANVLQLLDKCAVDTEIANLPSIDNDYDQMEVAEYVEEIYDYYWVTEVMLYCWFFFLKNWPFLASNIFSASFVLFLVF